MKCAKYKYDINDKFQMFDLEIMQEDKNFSAFQINDKISIRLRIDERHCLQDMKRMLISKTKNFPEFSGSQQKLSNYFKTKPEKRKSDSDVLPVAIGKKKAVAQQKNISSFFIKQ